VINRQASEYELRDSGPSSRVSVSASYQTSSGTRKLSHASSVASTSKASRGQSYTSDNSSVALPISIIDPSELPAAIASSLKLSAPYPWAKEIPDTANPSAEEIAVDQFFEKYVMYPCNQGSTPGFLEHLPSLFREFQIEGRLALRWAVRATAYASLSKDQDNEALGNKALQCYGRALSALADALKNATKSPDDITLMTVVILDIFEVCLKRGCSSTGLHVY
jgi:hypothetical protein